MKTAASQSLLGCFGVFTGEECDRGLLHVAVHTDPHVTPAAYPLAVQFNQADDMQHAIPLKHPAHNLIGGFMLGGMCKLQGTSMTSLEHKSNWPVIQEGCTCFVQFIITLKPCVTDFLI